jgi:hypothetical protein
MPEGGGGAAGGGIRCGNGYLVATVVLDGSEENAAIYLPWTVTDMRESAAWMCGRLFPL